MFLYLRKYWRARTQARTRRTCVPQNHVSNIPFVKGPFQSRSPGDISILIGGRTDRDGKSFYNASDEQVSSYLESGHITREPTRQRYNGGYPTLHMAKHPYLLGADPWFVNQHQGPEGSLGRRAYQQTPKPPPYSVDLTTADHSSAVTQSSPYLQSPHLWHVSQAPSSPSIYPPTLSMRGDDCPIHPLPTSTSIIACPEPAAAPLDRGEDSGITGACDVLVGSGACMMTPLHSEDDAEYPVISQERPARRPRPSHLPPIPRKRPHRRGKSIRHSLGASFFDP